MDIGKAVLSAILRVAVVVHQPHEEFLLRLRRVLGYLLQMRHSLLAFCHRHVVCKFYDESVFDTCNSITSLYLEFYC